MIALRVRFTSDEDGLHESRMSVTELDGHLLGPPVETKFESKSRENEEYAWVTGVIRLVNIRIREPNDYLLTLQIDGQSIASTTIYIHGSKEGDPNAQSLPVVRLA
jgi:hypothetical protein